MGNLVKYGTWTPEARKQEAEELSKVGGGDFMKLAEGRNVLRFLPPRVGQTTPFVMVWQHYVKKPGDTSNTSFPCPRMLAKQQCPVCDHCEALRKTGSPADRELAYQMGPRLRILSNVIDRSAPDKGPQILGFGKSVHEQLLALAQDADAGGDFTNPVPPGYDVIITRTGTGQNTKYQVLPAKRASDLGNMDWIDAQPDLTRFATLKTPDEIADLLGIGATTHSVGSGQSAGAAAANRSADMGEPRRTAQDVADEDDNS